MTDATTPNYGWAYPTVGADEAVWGGVANTLYIAIDASLKTVDDGLAARLAAASNLSDLADAATARTNLGLGTAATANASTSPTGTVVAVISAATGNVPAFSDNNGTIANSGIAATDILTKSGNLSSLANAGTARSNLGLGSIATHNVTISSSAPSGGSDGDIWLQYT